jgi:prevent-host-death family protein
MLIPVKLYVDVVQIEMNGTDMKQVSISELRANLLDYLTRVQRGERFMVTSRGRAMATLISPVNRQEEARARLEELARTAVLHDVVSPLDEPWEAAG